LISSLLKIKKAVKIIFSTTFRKKKPRAESAHGLVLDNVRVSAHHRQIGAKVIKIPVIIAA
jgi:hypothetical protein